ncbi:MAG: DsrH/TusB family sulfur relay protein [Pseudomonadales bacterium]
MILHTFNSPEAFARHSQRAASTDQLLLIEDGVFCLVDPAFSPPAGLLALQEDLELRGITRSQTVNLISYKTWVDLVVQSQHTLSWT